jgi:hypothetical protein
LKRPGDPALSDPMGFQAADLLLIKQDPAVIRTVKTGHHVENGRFPRSIRTDEAYDFPSTDFGGQPRYCLKAAKRFG